MRRFLRGAIHSTPCRFGSGDSPSGVSLGMRGGPIHGSPACCRGCTMGRSRVTRVRGRAPPPMPNGTRRRRHSRGRISPGVRCSWRGPSRCRPRPGPPVACCCRRKGWRSCDASTVRCTSRSRVAIPVAVTDIPMGLPCHCKCAQHGGCRIPVPAATSNAHCTGIAARSHITRRW